MHYMNLSGVHESILYVCMSPYHNGFSVLQHFEQDNMVEIRNRKMFDFFPGLPHVIKEICGRKKTNIISLRISTYEYVHHNTSSVGGRIGRRRKKQQGERKERENEEGMGSWKDKRKRRREEMKKGRGRR